ncbi:RICIN domain-containing protein [Massilia sp. CF038]|uniref:RICIN domain-containing protein n=1 Tax=Massilia sp. CF038 TaxID=1881045 RepID=UPI000923D2A5|nr:RICIN domain-containing protein [Massilia sp. CF038]SHG47309.1 chitinase [Massilia sp. CF038]
MQARAEGGLNAATIAFGISGGGCTLSGGMENIMSGNGKTDVQQFVAAGGRVILSFGGASGSYLESRCSETDMFNLIRNIMDTHKVYSLDFDIEGSQLGVASLNTTRNNVIKRLQAAYPNLYVSFTLPVDPAGLPGGALTLLRSANSAGVKVSVVNIMAMDYGAQSSSGRNMGDLAISAANATFGQIKGIFTGRTDAQLWAMIGITPMIGVNDVTSEVFRQADAQKVTDFARQKKLGLLSFWNLQRDRPGSGSLNDFSLVNTRPYEFYQIMKVAKDTTVPPVGSVANGRYTIVSAHSGKCVDVAAASTADGANIQQYQCNGTGAQAFDVTNMGNDVYRILNANSGKAVDVASSAGNDGANIQQWTSNNTGAQRFVIKASGNGFSLRNQSSGKCMDVADWSTADGGNIHQWTCAGTQNQVFRFVK